MGISYLDLKVYWESRLKGTSFNETVTIGRQSLSLYPGEVKLLRRAYYSKFTNSKIDLLGKTKPKDYVEGVFRDLLDTQVLSSIDYSSYEGADIVHDLNLPVPHSLLGRFDAVIDGGSLEHIFNFPIAISNMMRMAKVGGKVFITTPANNYCGHGFYQFSPEVMFRVFVPDNGFKLNRILFYPARTADFNATSNRLAYEVIDPINIKNSLVFYKRVELVSRWPVLMMAEATRIADMPIFANAPLQSDYVDIWNLNEFGVQIVWY